MATIKSEMKTLVSDELRLQQEAKRDEFLFNEVQKIRDTVREKFQGKVCFWWKQGKTPPRTAKPNIKKGEIQPLRGILSDPHAVTSQRNSSMLLKTNCQMGSNRYRIPRMKSKIIRLFLRGRIEDFKGLDTKMM